MARRSLLGRQVRIEVDTSSIETFLVVGGRVNMQRVYLFSSHFGQTRKCEKSLTVRIARLTGARLLYMRAADRPRRARVKSVHMRIPPPRGL